MDITQSIGNANELKCIARFIELGCECSIPYGNSAKYDFIADTNFGLLKIQCKSSNRVKRKDGSYDDAFQIDTTTVTINTKETIVMNYSKDQIDYFATSFENQVYLIPVEECNTSKTLRFSPPRNNNQNYNKAEDYEIEKIIEVHKDFNIRKNVIQTQQKIRVKRYCDGCGKEISYGNKSGYCAFCYPFFTRKTDWPTKEELKRMIRTESFVSLGKKYNVSDKAVCKWCEVYGLPSRRKDINSYSDEDWERV